MNILVSVKQFEEFYRTNFTKIYGFLFSQLKNHDTCKDLTQNVFIKVYLNWYKLQQTRSKDAYLFTITKHTLLDFIQQQKIDIVSLTYAQHIPIEQTDVTDLNEKISKLHYYINLLPKKRKQILILNKFEGLTIKEIAHYLSITERTVENNIYRAMSALKKNIL